MSEPSDHNFTFRLIGKFGEWYLLRAPVWSTSRRNALDAHALENAVFSWTMAEVDEYQSHLGYGNAHGYIEIPKPYSTGNGLCLMLKRETDLVRFANAFRVADMANLDQVLENA